MAVKRIGKARKAAGKKAVVKKAAAKRATAKKAASKKIVAKKAVPKKAIPRKAASRKAIAKKSVAKKAAEKSVAPKRAAAKKPAAKKPAAKKAVTKKAVTKKAPVKPTLAKKPAEVTLLSGGNPQIAKGFGNAPVKAYIAAMPGWKRKAGAHLDKLIERAVPQVYKAVKWNSPLYGLQGEGWFIGIHCYNEYIKVAFFRGASLNPPPPGPSTQKWVRYLNLRKEDAIDEVQFMDWVKQASQLPGEKM